MKGRIFLRGKKSLQAFDAHGTVQTGLRSLGVVAALLLSACGTHLPDVEETGRHIPPQSDASMPTASGIPGVVTPLPLVEPPQPGEELELYTTSVLDVPVRELLFTLARDAAINVDVHPDVTGNISLNAVNQTLPQILERISRQVDMRWSIDDFGNIVVEPDSPVWKTYRIDYVNVARTSETDAQISTNIVNTGGAAGGGGGASNSSAASLNQTSSNNFWETLNTNLQSLMGGMDFSDSVISNPETGIVSVLATEYQHVAVAGFLNDVQTSSLRQVLIEATVVEVQLSDEYQSGVDWEILGRNNGEITFRQTPPNGFPDDSPTNILTIDRLNTPDAIKATISMLSQFGESRVLSSPKIMALNNQSAMLRVVENEVYFTVEVEPGSTGGLVTTLPAYTTTPNTVPVGFSMTVTPQVADDDQVTLNVRPTISRISRYVPDPNPIFADGVSNEIPVIQVREFESVLKVFSGQTAILGGLMEDKIDTQSAGLPVLSRLPGIRNLFSYRDDLASKTELIIFIRPIVVRQPSLDGDLRDYRHYLPANGLEASGATLPEGALSLPGGE